MSTFNLTNIMRACKKEYYNKILDKNKDNIKDIWNVLPSIIKRDPEMTHTLNILLKMIKI